MVHAYRLKFMEWVIRRLDKMLSGTAATGIALPEELVTQINTLRQAVADNISSYTATLHADSVLGVSVVGIQDTSMLLLRRAREAVGPNLSAADRHALWKQYGLLKMEEFGQERLLDILAQVIAASDLQTDPELKVPADIIADIQAQLQALQQGLDSRRHCYAEEIDLRLVRVELELQYRKVRNQVKSFLIKTMPKGSRDPRLTDFGFRPSVLRRRQDASEEVVVVEAVEAEEAVVVETETSS